MRDNLGKHGEGRIALGINSRGGLLEIWSNPWSMTFTITITAAKPGSPTCIVDHGKELAGITDLQGLDI